MNNVESGDRLSLGNEKDLWYNDITMEKVIDATTFQKVCAQYDIAVNEHQLSQLQKYMDLLRDWNTRMNLTAITEPEEIWSKHFLDSILPFQGIKLSKFADVGSGAGFPCLPLKIVFPEIECTMIEPLQKRCRFLEYVIESLDLKGIQVVHERAEDYAKKQRECFDGISARAVARLPILLELCAPLCKVSGRLIFLKGKSGMEELEESQKALSILGLRYDGEKTLSIDGATHINLYFTKEKKTSLKYPRPYGQIKKKPLGG